MAKSSQVKVCISKNNNSNQALIKLLQRMHIEAVKELVKARDLTDSQLCHLLMAIQERGKFEK